ncbi:MAG: hypothetical protein RBT78_12205 [Kiritimatiellia bacterium]|jgi:hypothetical protein|nr:hypothetical protein [Kiritimatiellia bacterium]
MNPFLSLIVVFAAFAAFGDITYYQSKWQAADGVWNGNFSDTAHWDTGVVPCSNDTTVANGYIIPTADAIITVNQAATVPYLHMDAAAGKAGINVASSLTVLPAYTNYMIYRPENGTTVYTTPRGLWLLGGTEMTIPNGSSVRIDVGNFKKVWRDMKALDVRGGSKIHVDGGELAVTNLNIVNSGYEKLYLAGTETATSRIDVVNGGVLNLHNINLSTGFFSFFQEYALLNVVNSDFNLYGCVLMGPSAEGLPGPELRFSGTSRYISRYSANVEQLFGSGTVIFSDYASFTNAEKRSQIFHIRPRTTSVPCRVEFRDHSRADFNGTGYYGSLFVGLGLTAKGGETYLTFDSDNEFRVHHTLAIGATYGYAQFDIKKGYVHQGGIYGTFIGTDFNNTYTNVAVTGVVNVAGGILNVTGSSSTSTFTGLAVGDGRQAPSAENTNYRYGELNIAGGGVSNTYMTAVGLGYADGAVTISGGFFMSDGHVIIGMGGGKGEWRMTGGAFRQDLGHGSTFVGGARLSMIGRTAITATYPEDRHNAKGLFSLKNASYYHTAYGERGIYLGDDGEGTLELCEGGTVNTPWLYATNGANSILKFDLSGENPGQVTIRKTLYIDDKAKLVVDGSRFSSTSNWVQLVTFNSGAKYGDKQGVSGGDRFCDVECIGPVKVVQNPTDDPARPGIWAQVAKGLVFSLQ